MSRQDIFTGTTANDGTGEPLRSALQKVNLNFVEMYQKLGIDSDNLAATGFGDSGDIVFEGGSFNTILEFVQPTAARTVTVPDASGTLVLDVATQTLTNKTLRLPDIHDSDNNEVMKFAGVTSAVNAMTLTNAATGNAPSLTTYGTDANINLDLNAKGSGAIVVEKASFGRIQITANGAVSVNKSHIQCFKPTALALTMGDGTVNSEVKYFTNSGTGTATVTPTNFALGTNFAIPQNHACQVMWDSDNWYVVGSSSGVIIT